MTIKCDVINCENEAAPGEGVAFQNRCEEHSGALGSPWGKSAIETPLIVYTRRWERWLAIVWPPKRRRLAMMNALAEVPIIEVMRMSNQIRSDLLLYGTTMARWSWETPDNPADPSAQEASQKRSSFTDS